ARYSTESAQDLLIAAIEQRNIRYARQALSFGADVNSADAAGRIAGFLYFTEAGFAQDEELRFFNAIILPNLKPMAKDEEGRDALAFFLSELVDNYEILSMRPNRLSGNLSGSSAF